jgi:predicted small lipoprotein YifL
MKTKALILSLAVALATTGLAGCGQKTQQPPAPSVQKPANQSTDVKTTASVVNDNAAFEKAISKNGTWIIAILKDMKFDKELVVDGDFKNGKKDEKTGAELYQRKIALYTQDDKKNVTARFTLTAPKITFNSSFGSLEHGTFVGDVYVAGKNFKLVNQQIKGNLYFLNDEAKNTFTIADKEGNPKSTISGVQELKK